MKRSDLLVKRNKKYLERAIRKLLLSDWKRATLFADWESSADNCMFGVIGGLADLRPFAGGQVDGRDRPCTLRHSDYGIL